jgi:hypothetical protein
MNLNLSECAPKRMVNCIYNPCTRSGLSMGQDCNPKSCEDKVGDYEKTYI